MSLQRMSISGRHGFEAAVVAAGRGHVLGRGAAEEDAGEKQQQQRESGVITLTPQTWLSEHQLFVKLARLA